jgi:hypothetical protein
MDIPIFPHSSYLLVFGATPKIEETLLKAADPYQLRFFFAEAWALSRTSVGFSHELLG